MPPQYKCKLSILGITVNAAKATSHARPSGEEKWSRPEPRCVKLNVDASFFPDTCTGAVGTILRDFQGTFIAASCLFLQHISSANLAEATTIKEGLSLASMMGYSNIIAESDSLETVEALTGEYRWWNASAAIFADCVDFVAAIGKVEFKHCSRKANQTAHEIARFSFLNDLSCNWVEEPPGFLLNKLVNDVTIVDD